MTLEIVKLETSLRTFGSKCVLAVGEEPKSNCELQTWFLVECNYFCCQVYYSLVHNTLEIKIPHTKQKISHEEVKIGLAIIYTGAHLQV